MNLEKKTSRLRSGASAEVFASLMEHDKLPIFAAQFHPVASVESRGGKWVETAGFGKWFAGVFLFLFI